MLLSTKRGSAVRVCERVLGWATYFNLMSLLPFFHSLCLSLPLPFLLKWQSASTWLQWIIFSWNKKSFCEHQTFSNRVFECISPSVRAVHFGNFYAFTERASTSTGPCTIIMWTFVPWIENRACCVRKRSSESMWFFVPFCPSVYSFSLLRISCFR